MYFLAFLNATDTTEAGLDCRYVSNYSKGYGYQFTPPCRTPRLSQSHCLKQALAVLRDLFFRAFVGIRFHSFVWGLLPLGYFLHNCLGDLWRLLHLSENRL
jgi:hypothetical protein